MPKKVALITLHGMGDTKTVYSVGFKRKMEKALGSRWEDVSFHSVYYASVFQTNQNRLWEEMKKNNDLDLTGPRKFVLFGLGDAASLEYSRKNGEEYEQVMAEIEKTLKDAFVDLGEDPSIPVVIVAHSLGGHVISNYIWDNRKGRTSGTGSPEEQFIKLDSLSNLITMGCNIPLFVGGLKTRQCFEKPNEDFVWDNYYDPDDILGWPLKQLDTTYDIVEDHPINVGNLLTWWNPLSHSGYWTDSDVVSKVARVVNLHLK